MSWAVIEQLAAQYPWVRGINMMRNYGQHNALLCGVREAQYEVVVTMDDDLQHPPEEIPTLLAKLAEGYDVVYGAPRVLPHSSWRNVMSLLIKRLLTWVMGVRTFQEVSAFRAFRTPLREAFASYRDPSVLLDVLLSWGTTRFVSVPVDHAPRMVGKSNYDLRRLVNLALLVLTGFSTAPLRLASYIGFGFTLFGLLVFAYVVIQYLLVGSVPGFPFLASIISLFSGAQLFALGILGEYLSRIFSRSMDRPAYVVREVTSGRSGDDPAP
jgi:undecaprenyl-phosphate 4-deoxy-4-formamido-L-arabinose transferase